MVNGEAEIGEGGDCRIRNNRQEPSKGQPSSSTGGAALRDWIATKEELFELLGPVEWKLWVRPAFLLKLIAGGLLVALSPNQRIVEAARARLPELRGILEQYGYTGVGFTTISDD